jgi:hypothetical protein
VLRFVEENLSDVKPTIGLSQLQEEIAIAFESEGENSIHEEVPVAEGIEDNSVEDSTTLEEKTEIVHDKEVETDVAAESMMEEVKEDQPDSIDEHADHNFPASEEYKEDVSEEEITEEQSFFKPDFELSFDATDEEDKKEETKSANTQITFDDLLGPDYVDPVFVKPEDLAKEKEVKDPSTVIPIARSYNDAAPVISISNDIKSPSISLNDRMAKGIIIGLNDRIAFMNHLFANSSEDYNRVLSQLMTFDTFSEARDFIDTFVKPDYNNWEGKEEYADRFMEIVEKKFS